MCTIRDGIAHTTVFVIPVLAALAGMRNSSMGQPWGIDPITHHTMSGCSTTELHLAALICFKYFMLTSAICIKRNQAYTFV